MERPTYSKVKLQTASSSSETLLDAVDDDVGANEIVTDDTSMTMAELLYDDQGWTILSLAAAEGHERIVQLLLESPRFQEIPEYATDTVIQAVSRDHVAIVQLLWQAIPGQVDVKDGEASLLHIAARDYAHSVLQWLLPHFSSVDQLDKDGQTPLHLSIEANNSRGMDLLLRAGASVNIADELGNTALHMAIQSIDDEDECCEYLQRFLTANADVDIKNKALRTALPADGKRAAELTDKASIQHLLANEAGFRSQFPLHCIARANDVAAIDAWLAQQPVDEAQRKAKVLTALSVQDMDGLTVVMHAAKAINNTKPTQVLDQILPYCTPDTLKIATPSGETVLDMLLQAEITCLANPDHASNEALLKALEGVMVRLNHELDPTTLPDVLLDAKPPLACFGACQETHRSGATNYIKLAESKNWNELQSLLKTNPSVSTINDCDDKGYAVLHHVCKAGSASTLHVLLQQTQLDINLETENDEQMSAIALAAANERIKCVRLLLLAGADHNVDEDVDDTRMKELRAAANPSQLLVYDSWALAKSHPDYYFARLPNTDAAMKCIQAKQTALHAAMHMPLPEYVLDYLTEEADLDAPDDAGETALMVAAKLGHLPNVRYLVEKDVDIDLRDKTGCTALMLAAVAGHGDVAEYLVNHLADIMLIDETGRSVLEKLDVFCRTQPAKDNGRDVPQAQILEMLRKEAQTRATSQAFRDKVALSMITQTTDEIFGGDGADFPKAIQCSLKLGQTFLDDCITLSRHEATFSKLDVLYGSCAEKSALHTVLNMPSTDVIASFETKKACLEHVAFRRLLEIKWELFGQRKYIEQLLMNVLLLLTMTTSSVLFTDELPPFLVLVFGISAVTLVIVAYAVVQGLRPALLWRLARYFHDGSVALDVSLTLPDLPQKKALVRHSLVLLTTGLTLACVLPLLFFADAVGMNTWFASFNNGVLGLTASYFVINEVQEMRADIHGYMASSMNKAQMRIYLLIVLVFVPMKMEWFAVSFEVQRIPKAQLELSVEQADALMASASHRAAWHQQMQALDTVVDKKMDLVRDGLLHIDHFIAVNVKTAFADELKAVESSRKQIKDAIETARRSRGEFSTAILARLRRRTKKELEKFQRNMDRLWKPKATGKGWDDHAKGAVLYELTQRASIAAQLQATSDSIQTAVNDPANVQLEEKDDANDGEDYSYGADDGDAPEDGMAQLKRESTALKVANEAQAKQIEAMTSKLDVVTTKLDTIAALLGHRADATESMRRQSRF
ncbi:hypothetical protein SDRG_15063 [Saprolegnia diclina VS20]|uniref:Uncharacterized protein n=1 Tax=Saprolegnia diclina (strain VS20) TaxID=1156394 RepID=T0PY29_SAPDV|nr:hypothetical protein SDRG_15063 [Saprolegnia diclina VS20]EQC27161.1 hypothetical protein SDRG_15063 [Saprolegnia diclina VS20]|eukprot:XP_008619447.1 hypothetical protein SDRG_15063 [Saprolegnia diclina VS20]